MDIKWTIQGFGEKIINAVQEFATKREAVNAIEAQRQPKTQINRIGHHYNFAVRKG